MYNAFSVDTIMVQLFGRQKNTIKELLSTINGDTLDQLFDDCVDDDDDFVLLRQPELTFACVIIRVSSHEYLIITIGSGWIARSLRNDYRSVSYITRPISGIRRRTNIVQKFVSSAVQYEIVSLEPSILNSRSSPSCNPNAQQRI